MMLEVRCPISPGPSWWNKVRLLQASIRELHPSALVVASVGSSESWWAAVPADIKVRRVPSDEFDAWKDTRWPYVGTMMDRYKPPFEGDYVLMCDADVVCTGNFSDLFKRDAISGVMAHVPPLSSMDWAHVMKRFGIYNFSLDKEYSGWGTMVTDHASRFGPTYFNSGMVFGPRALFERLYQPYFEAIEFLRTQLRDVYFIDQIALALGLAKSGVPTNVLPLRYNFPNQAEFDRLHPDELKQVRFLHYMRTNIIDRDRDLESIDAMEKLIDRTDLTGSNEIFRQRLESLMPRIT